MQQIRVMRSGANQEVVTAPSNYLGALSVARRDYGPTADLEKVGTHTFALRGPFSGLVPPMFLAITLP